MNINILAEWKKEFFALSSDLHFKKQYEREHINGVESILLDYFGKDFFIYEINTISGIENKNWIHELLAQKDHISLLALFEICNILEYSKKLDISIQSKLKSTINSIGRFQDLFFEIYTYRLLDFNRIKNKKKIRQGNKELEGECWINDKRFIFECKKLYAIQQEEIDAVMAIGNEFFLRIQSAAVAKEIIGYVFLKKEAKTAKARFSKRLKDHLKRFEQNPNEKIDVVYEDDLGKMQIEEFDTARFIEYGYSIPGPNVIFRLAPPTIILPDKPSHFRLNIQQYFVQVQSKITKKLLEVIRKKRKQHKDSKEENRIFFLDNERLRSFKFPLLPPGQFDNDEEIQAYITSKDTKDVICIIDRDYIVNPPTTKIKVYCKEEFADVKAVLEGMKTNFDYILNDNINKKL